MSKKIQRSLFTKWLVIGHWFSGTASFPPRTASSTKIPQRIGHSGIVGLEKTSYSGYMPVMGTHGFLKVSGADQVLWKTCGRRGEPPRWKRFSRHSWWIGLLRLVSSLSLDSSHLRRKTRVVCVCLLEKTQQSQRESISQCWTVLAWNTLRL